MRESDKQVTGLSSKEVEERTKLGQVNRTKVVVGKTYFQIFKDNILSLFNIVLFVIAGLMIYAGYFDSLFFIVVLTANIIIGLYEDITARRLMDKMKISTEANAVVIRDGKKVTIKASEIVLGDIVELSLNSQISVDGHIIKGNLKVNESLLTGESEDVIKNIGDNLLSGTYVTSGTALMIAEKVGGDSYSNQLSAQAKKFKRSPSVILKSLRQLFRVISAFVISIAAFTVILYAVQGKFSDEASFKAAIGPISGSMVGMIPSGLYLLTSAALAVAVIALARKGAQVQDFYSVEMLARTTTLCIDKTGTITTGKMKVNKILMLSNVPQREIRHILFDLINATGDNNATASAIKKACDLGEAHYKVIDSCPFNSANKYSAVTFADKGTYVMGAPEFINISDYEKIDKHAEEYTEKGFRVLFLGANDNKINNGKVDGIFEPIALIVLEDEIKPSVKDTLKWFKDNGVKIKVISGDNALTVSKIARLVELDDADNYVSLEDMDKEQVKAIANKYTVFGRVTPEQKEILVEALKENGEKVAMTGDGVNDILALKKADCSIAMASGADSARDASHIVLLNNDFDSLPKVVGEGRRVINNLQRTCSLFLVKTGFTMFYSLLFLILSACMNNPDIKFPFITNYMYLWEFASIGMSSFFIALQPNEELIQGKFLSNILKKAIPGAVAIIITTSIPFILYLINPDQFAIYSINHAAQIGAVLFTIVAFFVLLKVCSPLDKFRTIVFIGSGVVNLGGLILCIIFSIFTVGWNFLKIDFKNFAPVNWLIIAITGTLCVAAYLLFFQVIKIIKGDKE